MAKPRGGLQQQLSVTGSRSLLEQLKPKGAGSGPTRLGQHDTTSDTSSMNEAGNDIISEEEASNRISAENSSSSIEDFNRGAPASKASTFRSMLGAGRMKGQLRRHRRLEDVEEKLDGGIGTDSRGRGLRLFGRRRASRGIPRPPVQPDDSLSSDEGTGTSTGRGENLVPRDDLMSPASSRWQESVSSSGEMTMSSSDEERDNKEGLDSANSTNDAQGGGVRGDTATPLRAAGPPSFQASQLKNSFLRLTRRGSRQPRAPQRPSSAGSTSSEREAGKGVEGAEEEEEEGHRLGLTSSTDSSIARASLLGNNLGRKTLPSFRGPRGSLWKRSMDRESGKGRQRKMAGEKGVVAAAAGGVGGRSTTRVSRTGAGPQRSTLPSWARANGGWGGWGSLDDCGGTEVAPVSGMGRPAAGAIENTLYGWFGRLAARNWPGVGLAPRPLVDEEDVEQMRERVQLQRAAREDDIVRVHVIGTDALPEDSRITRPMVVVHIVSASTGRYFTKRPPPKEWMSDAVDSAEDDDARSGHSLGISHEVDTDGVEGGRNKSRRVAGTLGRQQQQKQRRQKNAGKNANEELTTETEPLGVAAGGATTTFEERTLWNLTAGDTIKPDMGCAYRSVPPAATRPWMMTMQSPMPTWEEALVFAESYRRLLAPDTLILFELVDFAAALSRKDARKGGGLSKIAWAFLRPIGSRGECNVGIRKEHHASTFLTHGDEGSSGDWGRRSKLQLFEHQSLSVLARWQARQGGFPRLAPPAAVDVPDVYLQFLLVKRKRYPATLAVSVGPIPRPRPVLVTRRPMAPHEREGHHLSYEALAAMHHKSREDRENGAAVGILPAGGRGGIRGASDSGVAGAAMAARTRRLRDKSEACVLPDRLFHRVYAGQNGSITLAFSESGVLLAAACCDDPLPGRFPIRLIDSETGKCRHELRGHASMVYSLVWSPGDSFLLSASADGTAKVWYISSGSDAAGVGTRGAHFGAGAPASAESLPTMTRRGGKNDGPRLAWVLQHAPPCFVYAAVFQPAEVKDRTRGATAAGLDHPLISEASECALVVTGAYDRRLRLWDVATGAATASGGRAKMLGTLSSKAVHESHVNAIVYDARNSRLYSGDGAGVIIVWRRGGGGGGGRRGGVEDYGVLRKVQHADLIGKAITSLALAPRLRRGQLLVQAHGNTLRLLDLGTYQLVNPGFAGGATAESLIRASFSPDGRFVVSGSEKGQVRVWEAQEGKRVRTPLQTLGTACCLRDIAWHPHQHILALAGYGQDAPVLLYYGEPRVEKQSKGDVEVPFSSSAMEEQAAMEARASAEEHRRRLENRQRLRDLRIKRLRAKALGLVDGPHTTSAGPGVRKPESGVVAALAALTAGGKMEQQRREEHQQQQLKA